MKNAKTKQKTGRACSRDFQLVDRAFSNSSRKKLLKTTYLSPIISLGVIQLKGDKKYE